MSSAVLLADVFAPGGLQSVDSVFKLFSLWATEEIYGWIFLYVFPFAILISAAVRAYRGVSSGRGLTPVLEYLFWLPFVLFFLWPVTPTIGPPALPIPDEDRDAFNRANETLLKSKERKFKGVPRLLLWGMALADTFTNEATVKIYSLNAGNVSKADYLRLRVANATPTDEALAKKSAFYWVLCYEPALWRMQAEAQSKGDSSSGAPLQPLDPALDSYAPLYSTDEWNARIESAPGGDALKGVYDCGSFRQSLINDYQKEIHKNLIGKNEHETLLKDLREAGVEFTDEEYIGYLVRQSATANHSYISGMRSVLSGQMIDGQQHSDYLPVNDDDSWYYRWPAKAVNWVANVFSDVTAGVGTRMDMPGLSKRAYESFKMLGPSLHGASMLFVIIIFPFISIAVVAGNFRPLLTYWKLYLAISLWPFLWSLLGAYQLFFTERSWTGLAAFMGDAGTYTNVAMPFLYIATAPLSLYMAHAAFGFFAGGGKDPVSQAGAQKSGGSNALDKQVEKRVEGGLTGGASGAIKGGLSGAMNGGAEGSASGGLGGTILGATLGGVKGAAMGGLRGLADGVFHPDDKKDSSSPPRGSTVQDKVMGKGPAGEDAGPSDSAPSPQGPGGSPGPAGSPQASAPEGAPGASSASGSAPAVAGGEAAAAAVVL